MSRILNRQRQLAEQGRIRLGYMLESKGGKSYPKASQTFVLTSHSREHIEAAASLWGGEVEQWQPQGNGAEQWRVITAASEIDAILPPGDPLSQAYEMWNRGGCIRRCDGVTEQLSGSPCQCLAQYGDDWHEQPQGKVCDSKSRLKVLLPDMPGLGSWRLETGSYYATDEIAGMVDFIRGAVGDTVMVPVRLRIEPRTRVAKGQTKQFVVPVLDLRGVTAREIVSGSYSSIRQVEGGESQVAAIESGRPDYVALAQRCESLDAIKSVYADAQAAGVAADVLAQIVEIGKPLAQAQAAPSSPSSPVEAEIVTDVPEPDADAIWQQILAEAGRRKMALPAIEEAFVEWSKGVEIQDADTATLTAYLGHLKAGA